MLLPFHDHFTTICTTVPLPLQYDAATFALRSHYDSTNISSTTSLPLHHHLHYHRTTISQHLANICTAVPLPLLYHCSTISRPGGWPGQAEPPTHSGVPSSFQPLWAHIRAGIGAPLLEAGLAKPSLPRIMGSPLLGSRCWATGPRPPRCGFPTTPQQTSCSFAAVLPPRRSNSGDRAQASSQRVVGKPQQ